MEINGSVKPRRRLFRPFVLVATGVVALSLAGTAARSATGASARPQQLTTAQSLEALRAAFGDASERPLREPSVVVAPTSAATWDLADDVNIANAAHNPKTGRTWARGNAQTMWPHGLDGFADPVKGTVYVNAATAVETSMAHEILHANASLEFLEAVGVAINEGTTEQFALDALAAAGVEVRHANVYPRERALAAEVVRLTGRDRLLRAYFNGGAHLVELVGSLGAGTLAAIRGVAAGRDANEALRILAAGTSVAGSPAPTAPPQAEPLGETTEPTRDSGR